MNRIQVWCLVLLVSFGTSGAFAEGFSASGALRHTFGLGLRLEGSVGYSLYAYQNADGGDSLEVGGNLDVGWLVVGNPDVTLKIFGQYLYPILKVEGLTFGLVGRLETRVKVVPTTEFTFLLAAGVYGILSTPDAILIGNAALLGAFRPGVGIGPGISLRGYYGPRPLFPLFFLAGTDTVISGLSPFSLTYDVFGGALLPLSENFALRLDLGADNSGVYIKLGAKYGSLP
jgi:hypothetical protein